MANKPQEITGVVYKVFDAQTGTGKKGEWTKQSFVVETKDQYPVKISFQAWNDNCDLIPKAGNEVKVVYSPESREYNEKWYTDLKVVAISIVGDIKTEKKAPVKTGLELGSKTQVKPLDEDDDLPF
jgi:hypothetical protein